MNVTQDFERWAKGFSGCDGGNPRGAIWFCGIEWGTGKEHDLVAELKESVSEPPQLYHDAEDNLTHPYNIKALKLISAMRDGSVSDFRHVARETPFPFHRESQFFKLNLFPVAYRRVKDRDWNSNYKAATGLETINAYLEWCRENRFPSIRSWMERGQPKLVIGVGSSCKKDFKKAFGSDGAEVEEIIEGKNLVWTSYGKAILAIIPFLGQFQLDSDRRLQAFGERLGAILKGQ